MIQQSLNGNFSSVIEPEAMLLLATAKVSFRKSELDYLATLIERVSDWDYVVDTADRKFSASYLHRALSNFGNEIVPSGALERLGKSCNYTRVRAMKVASAQIAFHKTCIAPLNVSHAYIKGIALSTQFGGQYSDRLCRDIDVLVDEDQFEEVVLTAFKSGYKVLISPDPLVFATSDNDLKFIAKFPTYAGLIGPEGVLIEVHRRLDKSSLIFNNREALSSAKSIDFAGFTFNTLDEPLHFAYVCYHHSRHMWSRLHWLADINLMLGSNRICKTDLIDTANALGLLPTVEASITLNEFVNDAATAGEKYRPQGLANDFLSACLTNLAGDLALEFELRRELYSHDLMTKSQVSRNKLKSIALANWKDKLRPVPSQYLRNPLPAQLFWLYRIERPFLNLGQKVAKSMDKTVVESEAESRSKIGID